MKQNEQILPSRMQMLAVFVGLDALVVLCYLALLSSGSMLDLFDLDMERSFGAWWFGAQFAIAGAAVLFCGLIRTNYHEVPRWLYGLIGSAFLYLSADEVCGLHERANKYINIYMEVMPNFPGGHGTWIFGYALVGLVLMALTSQQLLRLFRADPISSGWIAAGFALIILGGVFIEIIQYYLLEASWLQVLSEETLELLGASFVTIGAVSHVTIRCADLVAVQAKDAGSEKRQRYSKGALAKAHGV